ncbi:hypothetical protein O6072_22965 [Mycolicibacterium neoaurum]|uniref:hypothetical protein n=1 Tax=Mycolicibacterium neoaurum TaxID=1795 RepID=UPI00248AD138|nr:hypothetical protein [Mycolicibacterium neoaurum]WBP93862.1 hypothetical protein O7W24_22460 [Mycolicibacterium neoaurum]WBS07655.1 hypothetical protein O6072_22965 [Mycolicibacterium neoaurum]
MSTTQTTEVDDTVTEPATTKVDTIEVDEQPDDADDQDGQEDPADGAETFTRAYVEKLRRESQRYRERAGEADALAQRLHTALVAATGKLADPADLPFDAAHLDEADGVAAMAAAIDELLAAKPHLRSRRPFGDIGQGATRSDETVDLAGILRSRA